MTLTTPTAKQTTDVDRLVGLRITALRKMRGLSQTALGTAVGVTFQQVQKYEKGQNRVGAGRLREIARLLEVPVSSLFGDDTSESGEEPILASLALNGAPELLDLYGRLPPAQRISLLQVARAVVACFPQTEAA